MFTNPVIFGITGKIGSGKTTVSDYLAEEYEFDQYSFADPIKHMAKAFGFKHHEVFGTQEQKLEINEHWGVSGRHFLQKLGTDIFRDIVPNIIPNLNLGKSGSPWIRSFEINMLENGGKSNVVIGDVRFIDEAKSIQDMGGHIIKIEQLKKETMEPVVPNLTCIHNKHTSETEMDGIHYDFVIYNTGTLDELYDKIDNILCSVITDA
jgi:hypothetical protein